MPTVIPKQYYVTVQYQKSVNSETNFLGFASPYTKDAGFRKRKATQEQWAYGSKAAFEIQDDDSIVALPNNLLKTTELFISNAYPKIVDNELVSGFQIARSVRRSGYSGGGNVVWRITDPRGYDLEISSENFAKLVDGCTLINGVIQEKCCWGRDGPKNILLPETSTPYLDAVKQTSRVNSTISPKDVQIGDIVNIICRDIREDEQDGVEYLGIQHALIATGDNVGYISRGAPIRIPEYNFAKTTVARTIFKLKSGKYLSVTTPKISSIVTRAEVPRTAESVSAELTAYVQNPRQSLLWYHGEVFYSPSKIKLADVTCELIKTDIVAPVGPLAIEWGKGQDLWPGSDSYYSTMLYICEHENQFWLAGVSENFTYGRHFNTTLIRIDLSDLTSHQRFIIPSVVTPRNSTSTPNEVITIIDGMNPTVYQVKVKYNGIEGIVTRVKR